LADRRFLHPDCRRQRILPGSALNRRVVVGVAEDQGNCDDANCAVSDGLVLVMLKERDAMFDFQGELVGF
jgi:hypothetical protein